MEFIENLRILSISWGGGKIAPGVEKYLISLSLWDSHIILSKRS